MDQEPAVLSGGVGNVLADAIPFMPSGARRAGSARLMAARMLSGHNDPSFLVKYPMASQALAALIGGGAGLLARPNSAGAALTGVFLPLTAVQLAKALEIRRIQSDYEKQKHHRRLADVQGLDDMLGRDKSWLSYPVSGSSRLGLASAYQAMRDRRRKDIPAYAEAGDVLALGMPGGTSLPFTSILDNIAATGLLRKNAAAVPRKRKEEVSHTDQLANPTIPYYLAAAWLGSKTPELAGNNLMKHLAAMQSELIPREKWDSLVSHVSGTKPVVAQLPGFGNAFHAYNHTKDPEISDALWNAAMSDPKNLPGWWPSLKYLFTGDEAEFKKPLKDQIDSQGFIGVGTAANGVPGFNTAPIIAHEGGHGKIERDGGVLRFLQRHPYRYRNLLAPLAGAGGFAAGMYAGGPLRGALAGALTGGLVQSGTVLPEIMASHYGLKALKSFDHGSLTKSTDRQRLLAALLTYLSTTVAVPTLAGAAGGWISSRRKKKQQLQAQ